MTSKLNIAFASGLAMSATACMQDPKPISVEGLHYSFVVSEIHVPSTANEAAKLAGIDLDGDGKTDNQLGQVFATLRSVGFDVQSTLTDAVVRGQTLLALDVQTPDLSNADNAGVQLLTGISASPSPCADATDTACGHHLNGHGATTVNAATDAMYSTGPMVDDILQTTGGIIPIRLALDANNFIDLNLYAAHLKIEHITPTATTAILAGGMFFSDRDTIFIPQVAAQFRRVVEPAHCIRTGNKTTCEHNPRAEALLHYFDDNGDQTITDDELRHNSIVRALLEDDVTIDNVKYLSFGVSVKLVAATFTYR
jgi:hypothetical protein